MSSVYGQGKFPSRMGTERRIIIDEVNTNQHYVVGDDAHGHTFQVSFDFQGAVTSIPQQGELWVIKQYQNQWLLDRRVDTDAQIPVTNLAPGDKRIEAPNDIHIAAGGNIRLLGQQATVNDEKIIVESDPRLTDQRIPPDGSVTTPKLASQSVTPTKINPGLDGQWLKTSTGAVVWTTIQPSDLGTGTTDSTTYLRGDRTWATISTTAGTTGILAAQPAANTVAGKFYYATDQAVLYFSDGAAWQRITSPAGTTYMWYGNTAPTGYVFYDGSTLPSSTGIYAALATHLGGTTTPDTRGRMPVGLGTHADVNTIGSNEGVGTAANRRPKHRTSNALTLPAHVHDTGSAGYAFQVLGVPTGGTLTAGASGGGTYQSPSLFGTTGNPTSAPGMNGSIGTNNANDPLDSPAYITFAFIAKL